MSYIDTVIDTVKQKHPYEKEFIQSVTEVLKSLEKIVERYPKFESAALLERMVVPERVIIFRVPWLDDSGKVHVNTGYRVQFNSAIGPYKGGLRFHPSVNLGILKFLGFEQTFKNSLTGLPIGGGKGGSDFDPKGKSDNEIMKFCQSFMSELYRFIGKDTDVPAGDMGVGAREIGFLYGQYKRLAGSSENGVFTGKGLSYGGSLIRPQATGYGLLYLLDEMLKNAGRAIESAKILISGSGNVAIYAAEKSIQMGGRVIAMSDSDGYVLDENGINLDAIKEIKLVKHGRISDYINYRSDAKYTPGKGIWNIPCHIALPCATQNEINADDAKELIKNGCYALAEGANMPSTNDAIDVYLTNGILYAPGKAANAGGVATSALEMCQNSIRMSWTAEEVDSKLKGVMTGIYTQMRAAAEEFGEKDNFVLGANAAGFMKIADAMMAQGVC